MSGTTNSTTRHTAASLVDPAGQGCSPVPLPGTHVISAVREDDAVGDCAVCGPETPLRWRAKRGRWACLNQIQDYEKRRRVRPSGPRKYKPRGPRATLRSDIGRKYGLTTADYDALLLSQGGVCAICQGVDRIALCIDHCHATGRIRGLLCTRCNTGLGLLRDDPYLLLSARAYLLSSA